MSTNFKIKALPFAVATVFSSLHTLPSIAQEAEPKIQAKEKEYLESITVTARKVEERILDVPLAISAFSAKDMREKSIEELEDVAAFTPGLTFEDFSNGSYGAPVIRGASQFSVDQLEQNVSTFIDGVYIPRQYALDLGTLDMERIEVVKGPQSALYGANAFLGAINYVTRKADLSYSYGDVEVVLGDGGRRDISGEFSMPIIDDMLAVKIHGSISNYDGDWKNSHPAASSATDLGTDEDLGGWDNDAYGASLVAEPIDSVHLEIAYNTFSSQTESRAQSRLSAFSGDLNCGASAYGFLKVYCGDLPETPLEAGSDVETGFQIDPRSYTKSETDIFRFSGNVELTKELTLKYQFANIQGEVFSVGNADRSPLTGTADFTTGEMVNYFTLLPVGEFDYDSHEMRLEYVAEDGLYMMLGLYSTDGEDLDDGISGYSAPLWSESTAAITKSVLLEETTNDATIETEADAIFGRVSIPLLDDKLILAAEARYTDETKTGSDSTGTYEYKDSYFTPRVSLDYHIDNDNLLYISYAEGLKSGGINNAVVTDETYTFIALPDDERYYGPDENITYEIGTKNRFLEGRLEVNAAVYFIDWSDLQVSVAAEGATATTSTITANLGAAESKGIEIESTFAITDSITLNAGLALNDATYDDGTISQRVVRAGLCDDIVCNSDGDIGGNTLQRSSDTQWNLGAQYDGTLNDSLEYFLRGDVTYQSEQFLSELNAGTVPSRTLLNLRAGVTAEDWSVELWVKNATDEEYVSNAFYIASPYFVDYVPTWGNKRRMGITAKYNF
jgi:iron complex outermembrane receptor protein